MKLSGYVIIAEVSNKVPYVLVRDPGSIAEVASGLAAYSKIPSTISISVEMLDSTFAHRGADPGAYTLIDSF